VSFLVVSFLHFAIKKKSQETSSENVFEKNSKKSSHFEKESYEITKFFLGNLGRFSTFFF